MLQPPQLEAVSAGFAEQISDLRKFFVQAGIPVGTECALGVLASRLQADRGFHRDLTSLIWIWTVEAETGLRTADLLGIVALAAAGVQLAAEAQEADAHRLLRFLLEARQSLQSAEKVPSSAADPSEAAAFPQVLSGGEMIEAEPVQVSGILRNVVTGPVELEEAAGVKSFSATRTVSAGALPLSESKKEAQTLYGRGDLSEGRSAEPFPDSPNGCRRTMLLAFAACALLALGAGAWRFRAHRATPPAAHSPEAAATTGTPNEVSASVMVVEGEAVGSVPSPLSSTAGLQQQKRSLSAGRLGGANSVHSAPATPLRATPLRDRSNAGEAAASPVLSAGVDRSIVPLSAVPPSVVPPQRALALPQVAAIAGAGSAAPLIATRNAVPMQQRAVPADVLSRRLGSRSVPSYVNTPEFSSAWHPRLLRRQPANAAGQDELLAEVRPGENIAAGGTADRSTTARHAGAVAGGTVRPGVLGMMAGNILYSPSPAYPLAASAAHVQGEVRIQSQVDRDGNVSYARVVSGPPLLRDAALDAVQHWRYRPYLSGGKPTPMSAVAVLEFELP